MEVDKKLFDIATKAAHEAGKFLLEQYSIFESTEFQYKDEKSVVSSADLGSERLILKLLKSEFPDHSFFSEEEGETLTNSEYLWLIDPLDGTTNFTRRMPHFNVSIALLYKQKTVLGVVYDPLHDEMFIGVLGQGATLNDQPIKVSNIKELNKTVIVFGRGQSLPEKGRFKKIFANLDNKFRTPRILGSVALDICYVAAGRLDATVLVEHKNYDYAAGALIAREAGAKVTDFKNQQLDQVLEITDLIIANEAIHGQIFDLIQSV